MMEARGHPTECKVSIELYWVSTVNGAYFVADDKILEFVEYTWLNPTLMALLEKLTRACDRRFSWRRDVDDLSEYLEQEAVQDHVLEREIVQDLIDQGRLGCHLPEPRTLEEKVFRPGVTPELIGRNIKRCREARGMTLEELAEGSGFDVSEVLAYEDELEIIFAEQLIQIARALDIDNPEQLLRDI